MSISTALGVCRQGPNNMDPSPSSSPFYNYDKNITASVNYYFASNLNQMLVISGTN